jgi:hypothetical protein
MLNYVVQLAFAFFGKLGFLGTILIILSVLALLFFGPFAIVWALNTLFSLNIAYSWQSWLAVLILAQVLRENSSSK